MSIRPGMRLRSAVCDTEVVVVHAPDPDVDLRCGGHPMVALPGDPPAGGLALTETTGTVLGKRYLHEASGTEVLCTKAGDGGLTVGSEVVPIKAAKALPSSD
jgi:hypothetical protein